MEVYILDSLLRRIDVVDKFESLIWTERFREFGDFELIIRSTPTSREQFQTGTKLAMNESYRVMTVETVEDGTDDEGKRTLKVSGNSVESVLLDRVARKGVPGLTPWTITKPPADAARQLFHDICISGLFNAGDKLAQVVEAMHPKMVSSTILEPVDPVPVTMPAVPPIPVYDVIKELCDVWTLGFRLQLNFNDNQLYWDIYAGSDRTSGQTLRAPVIFSPNLDNLTNVTELNSMESSKNVAYVYAANAAYVAYPEDVDPDTDSFDRRVLIVDANDITLPYGTVTNGVADADRVAFEAACKTRGLAELSKNRAIQAFDGEINRNSQYKYQRDYYLGDLVEARNTDGVANLMRVTEQIFASDREGERAYPTLTKNTFVNTGSWLAQRTKVWVDYEGDPITWSEMP